MLQRVWEILLGQNASVKMEAVCARCECNTGFALGFCTIYVVAKGRKIAFRLLTIVPCFLVPMKPTKCVSFYW